MADSSLVVQVNQVPDFVSINVGGGYADQYKGYKVKFFYSELVKRCFILGDTWFLPGETILLYFCYNIPCSQLRDFYELNNPSHILITI